MRRDPALAEFAEALEYGIHPRLRPVLADLRDELLSFAQANPPRSAVDRAEAAIAWSASQLSMIGHLHEKAQDFNFRLLNSTGTAERETAVLDLAERLGADRRKLESDARALRRHFDADAVLERYRCRAGERERALAYGIGRAGELVAAGLADRSITSAAPMLEGAFARLLEQARGWRGDARVRQAAHRAMRCVVEAAPAKLSGFWVDIAVRDARRTALNPEESVWAQIDAMALLLALSHVSLSAVLQRRLRRDADQGSALARDNRLFLRRQLAFLLADAAHSRDDCVRWLQLLANDDDGAVRQALALALPRLPQPLAKGMFARLRVDRDPQVRGALLADVPALARAIGAEEYLGLIERVLLREQDEFVLRLAIACAGDFVAWKGQDRDIGKRLRRALTALRLRSESEPVRRWAGAMRERIWLLSDPQALEISATVRQAMAGLAEGEASVVPELGDLDEQKVGRVLSVIASHDFGFDFTPGKRPRLRRGDHFLRRLWRILSEGRISSTDKRQAWLHTIGRSWRGPVLAPSMNMAELAPTKVPGEPLHVSAAAGWRNYVPLLDAVLSAIDRGEEFRIYTSEGVTRVAPPSGLWLRVRAFLSISWNFGRIAPLRNSNNNEYALALRGAGVELSFTPHPDCDGEGGQERPDEAITRLFSAGGAIPALMAFWQQASTYFATVYENSLFQLWIFIALASGWFVVRHIWLGWRMRRRRRGIALVLGGWGTRGKSGTERLKAGLINALGHPLVSKTTGCEAMFLLGRSFGDLQEMFLFRPYDKATIWEQADLVGTARGLGARVFLWECMGLTPSYVRVLQKDWMRDDIATITNTYPDHEDVQGPAGRNIPEVMTQFIPENSVLLTTEEEMLPILRQGAAEAGTRIRPVGWKEAGLIHQSLLARFPYAEHPFNIALVTAMADEMGLPPDYAIKEMADRVVADLGVLKIYPHSTIDGRTLEFVMGMSANERFGAMGNWQRMGFATHDLSRDPEIFISTVVNNRADRVPRSRVFARMLVEDVSVDRHVLIGSNIDGLLGFIDECWEEYSARINIFSNEVEPAAAFEHEARRQRIPLGKEQVEGRLGAMLGDAEDGIFKALGQAQSLEATLAGVDNAADIVSHHAGLVAQLAEYETLQTRVAAGGDTARVESDIRDFLHRCFKAKLVPVHEYYTPGEEIVRLIARLTPPGLTNRILGMQNIKGTGLDFVYRWQAWEACHRACAQAQDKDPGVAQRGLDFLSAFQEYGVLSEAHVRRAMQALKGEGAAADARLDAIVERLDRQMAVLASEGVGESGGHGGGGRLIEWLEAFLDSTDAVRRRRAADRIYRELVAEQISSQRAALELKKLTARQKGGWLAPKLAGYRERLTMLTSWRGKNISESAG